VAEAAEKAHPARVGAARRKREEAAPVARHDAVLLGTQRRDHLDRRGTGRDQRHEAVVLGDAGQLRADRREQIGC
jgi:hypothetical protein